MHAIVSDPEDRAGFQPILDPAGWIGGVPLTSPKHCTRQPIPNHEVMALATADQARFAPAPRPPDKPPEDTNLFHASYPMPYLRETQVFFYFLVCLRLSHPTPRLG